MTTMAQARDTAATIFGRLFENEFATLDGIAISCRREGGFSTSRAPMGYACGSATESVRRRPLWTTASSTTSTMPCWRRHPEHEAVISGYSRHLRALLLEGFAPPPVDEHAAQSRRDRHPGTHGAP